MWNMGAVLSFREWNDRTTLPFVFGGESMNHSKRTLIMFTAVMSTALWIQTARQVPAAAPASAASAVPEELQPLTRGLDLGSLLDLGGILQEMGSASSGSNAGSSTNQDSGLDLGSLLENAGGLEEILNLFGLGEEGGSSSAKKKPRSGSSKKKSGSSSSANKKKSGSSSSANKKKSGSTSSSSGKKPESNSSGKAGSAKKSGNTGKSEKTEKRFTLVLSKTSYIYNGEARKPSVTVRVKGESVPKTAYTVTYKNNKSVGRATVTVKGKGDYSGYSAERTFKITLKKTTLSGVSSPAPGKVKASWSKDSQADGYQLQFCMEKEFSKGVKRAKIESGSKTTFTQENLASGKYYVRIRSYKKVGSSTWYSDWSGAKQVSVKEE